MVVGDEYTPLVVHPDDKIVLCDSGQAAVFPIGQAREADCRNCGKKLAEHKGRG